MKPPLKTSPPKRIAGVLPKILRLARPTRRERMTHLAILLIFLVCSCNQTWAQARLTSPSTSEALSTPTFTLRWERVGQVDSKIEFGSRRGLSDYFTAPMGSSTKESFTWKNAPQSVWVRLWSKLPVKSGNSNSSVAYYTWKSRDYFFYIGKMPTDRLVEAWLKRLKADHGKFGGECKQYLKDTFASTVRQTGYRTPDEVSPFMPRTSSGYYWENNRNSGFTEVEKVHPNASDKLDEIKNMLREVKRGDTLQFGARQSVNEKLHTLTFTAGYDSSGGGTLRWADSNWKGDGIVNSNQSRSLKSLAEYIVRSVELSSPKGAYPTGATLYRVRRDLE